MRIARACFVAFLCFSLATVLAEAGALGVVWARGGLSRERLIQLLAVANDVDLAAIAEKSEQATRRPDEEQLSFEEVVLARTAANFDLDLRDMAADKALDSIGQLDSLLEEQRQQYAQIKTSFDQQIERLRQGAADASLREVQRQLEAVQPKLAKDQLLRILNDPNIDPADSLHFVVTLFKAMPLEQRKKIAAEFKNEELERLHAILREIRRGVPEMTLIRDTRSRLKEFENQSSRPNRAALPVSQ